MNQHNTVVFISLGSNIDPQIHIRDIHEKLFSLLAEPVISTVYQSPAVGMEGNDFLNAVVAGKTNLSVKDIVGKLNQFELEAGRIRTENKFIDRTLDLDLLLYGDLVTTANDELSATLPHPEILEQAYVLQPLADIAGDLVHPVVDMPLSVLLNNLKMKSPEKFAALEPIAL